MIDIKKIFGDNFKRFRESKGLSQEKIAGIINIKTQSVGQFENYKNLASTETLQKICNTFEVSPCIFFTLNNFNLEEVKEKEEIRKNLNMILSELDVDKMKLALMLINTINSDKVKIVITDN